MVAADQEHAGADTRAGACVLSDISAPSIVGRMSWSFSIWILRWYVRAGIRRLTAGIGRLGDVDSPVWFDVLVKALK